MMSILNAIFNHRIHLKRYDEIVYKSKGVTSLVDIDPQEQARLEINFDSAQTGNVFINGTYTTATGTCDAGETVAFSAIKSKKSYQYFTNIVALCFDAGMATANVSVRAVKGDGSPVLKEFFQTSFYGNLTPIDESFKAESYGYDKQDNAILLCESDENIQLGDIIKLEDIPNAMNYEVIKDTIIQIGFVDDHRRIILR